MFLHISAGIIAFLILVGFISNCFKPTTDLFRPKTQSIFEKMLECFIPPFDLQKIIFAVLMIVLGNLVFMLFG